MPIDDPCLQVTDVVVAFGNRTVLDTLTITAERATVTAVLGPNGAGKTTLIRTCLGLIQPAKGFVRIAGAVPGSPQALQRIGVMPQAAGAWGAISAGELVKYLAKLYQHPHDPMQLLAYVGIADQARTPYRRLSGGQQHLVNLAGALVGRPDIVFLDEPTAGLDPLMRQRTWNIIRSLRTSGVCVVLTTHHMDEAEKLADHIWIIDQGKAVAAGTVAELTTTGTLEQTFLALTRKNHDQS